MELFALLFVIVQVALFGCAIFFNIAATRNWEASLARQTRWRRPEPAASRADPEIPDTETAQSATIRRAA
jgi:hypothetical protein